ncbi:CapA family protein [Staphylococcus nepalensis]|uniref:CapA family protein n=1 Tax=Staphylococcus nepalensis TaxID=214473 RepID=UPI003EE50BB8
MKQSKRFSIDEHVLKWSKRHKKRNSFYTGIILIIAILLIVFGMKFGKSSTVKIMNKSQEEIKITYLGNIELNDHIRINNINKTFNSIEGILKTSDYSSASLNLANISEDKKENIKENLKNIMVLKNLNIQSLNLVNESLDNLSTNEIERKIEKKYGYNYLTGNGSNPINSKTVQKNVKGKKIVNVSFSDITSEYTDPLKNTTSISLEPHIFIPLIQNLKKNNDYVVVNVDWGITDEKSVTSRQRKYAHALSEAGADIIVGHNSVIQEIEEYKGTNIFYSVGNVTSERFLSKNKQGLAIQQDWNDKNSKFMITPIKFRGGKISEAELNKIEEIKLLNNLNSKSVKLEKVDGGYVYES